MEMSILLQGLVIIKTSRLCGFSSISYPRNKTVSHELGEKHIEIWLCTLLSLYTYSTIYRSLSYIFGYCCVNTDTLDQKRCYHLFDFPIIVLKILQYQYVILINSTQTHTLTIVEHVSFKKPIQRWCY